MLTNALATFYHLVELCSYLSSKIQLNPAGTCLQITSSILDDFLCIHSRIESNTFFDDKRARNFGTECQVKEKQRKLMWRWRKKRKSFVKITDIFEWNIMKQRVEEVVVVGDSVGGRR